MREGSSDHKEASVYLAVMSADSRAPDTSTQPSVVDAGEEGSQQKNNVKDRVTAHPATPGGGTVDPRSSENTMSAFEITSVSTYQEDLETSMHHHKGTSADAESFVESAKKRGQSESSEAEDTTRPQSMVLEEQKESEHITDFTETEKLLPLEAAPNGPVMASGLRRFRRLNKYTRGRWEVQDASETEERQEGEQRGNKGSVGEGGGGGGGGFGRESPFVARKGGGGEGGGGDLSHQHSRSSSDLGGQGPDIAITVDKETHLDRSSMVPETASLSRNMSSSSLITAGDKSVDGEEKEQSRLKELEGEAEVTYPAAAEETLTVSSLQQMVISQTHSQPEATLPNSNVTAGSDSGGEDGQHGGRTHGGEHRVKTALSHLNEELQRMISENKEIDALKEEVKKLKEENSSLKEEKQSLIEENERLQRDLNKLTQDLKLKSVVSSSEDSPKSQLGDS